MKVILTNNSCSRLSRLYTGFELDLPGNKEITVDVPDEHVGNLKDFLRKYHPAVVFTEEKPPATSAAATTKDATVLDINLDDQEGITVEQHLRSLGLLSDSAPAAPVLPVTAPAPEASKAKKGGNLIPAKPKADKAKPAKSTGGKK